MKRRSVITTLAAPLLASCLSNEEPSNSGEPDDGEATRFTETVEPLPTPRGEAPVELLEWRDGSTDEYNTKFSAVLIEAVAPDPPEYIAFEGVFGDEVTQAERPANPERYGEVGQNLYLEPEKGTRGWLLWTPSNEKDIEAVILDEMMTREKFRWER